MMTTDMRRLTAAIGRRLRRVRVRLTHFAAPHQGFYGLSAAQDVSSRGVSGRNKPDVSANSATSSQAWLPIGPSCC